jgi:hypothetical protein
LNTSCVGGISGSCLGFFPPLKHGRADVPDR